ncbi:cyclic nucleotide-binding domain-containing protein [Candidatus Acetothermia bacterium]|nr:cyclic nucleotide-binding domain-containing protein [Candidatus Acetothermia bacterium]MBI3644296.1 cyclic nucleotide-binding domain-containing protein [Candidatus Acetothermia bacterium]
MVTRHKMSALLREAPLFQDLDERIVDLLAGCATNVSFDAGEMIYREGEAAKQFYEIRRGDVALEIFVPGRGPVTIETLHEKDVLGWSWLIEPYRWHFEARALTRVSAISFDAICIRGKCESDHELGYELMKRFSKIIVERLQNTRMQLLDVYGHI